MIVMYNGPQTGRFVVAHPPVKQIRRVSPVTGAQLAESDRLAKEADRVFPQADGRYIANAPDAQIHVIRTEPHPTAVGWHLGICSCGVASGPWPNKIAARSMIEEHADDVADEQSESSAFPMSSTFFAERDEAPLHAQSVAAQGKSATPVWETGVIDSTNGGGAGS